MSPYLTAEEFALLPEDHQDELIRGVYGIREPLPAFPHGRVDAGGLRTIPGSYSSEIRTPSARLTFRLSLRTACPQCGRSRFSTARRIWRLKYCRRATGRRM